MDRVRVVRAVDEGHAHALALARAERGPRDAPVVAPRREAHAGGELDVLVTGDEGPLAQHAPAREAPRRAAVEVAQDGVRVEAVGGVVDLAAAEAGVPTGGRVVGGVRVARRAVRGGRRGRRELRAGCGARPHGKRAGAQDGNACEHRATSKPGHVQEFGIPNLPRQIIDTWLTGSRVP